MRLVLQRIVHGADVGDNVPRLEHHLEGWVRDGKTADNLINEQAVSRKALNRLDEDGPNSLLPLLRHTVSETGLVVEKRIEQLREVLAGTDVVLIALGKLGEPLQEDPRHSKSPT